MNGRSVLRPPGAFISPSGDVMVPPEMARILFERTGLRDWARRNAGRRPDFDNLLEALRIAGERWWAGSDCGSERAEVPEVPVEWFSTGQVANATGYSDRWIRQLITDGHIEAQWVGGMQVIHREQVRHLQARKRAS